MSTRTPYPTDVSDEEWAVVAPYLTLLPEDAAQRKYPLREVFNDEQVVSRGMRVDLPHPDAKGGKIPGVRTPITINGRRAAFSTAIA